MPAGNWRTAFAGSFQRAQLVQRAHRHQLTAVDDPDAVAHALGNFEDMGREHHRRAAVRDLAQDILNQARRARIEPYSRAAAKPPPITATVKAMPSTALRQFWPNARSMSFPSHSRARFRTREANDTMACGDR